MPLPRLSARWHWLLLAVLLLTEFVWFDRMVSRNQAWIYPRWNDQVQYLTEAYTAYEYRRENGLLPALWKTLINPSAQGTLHDTAALLAFECSSASRSAALSLNGLAFVALQLALFAALRRLTQAWSPAWLSTGLLLCTHAIVDTGPGSPIDFRLDWMACGAYGATLATAVFTEGFRRTRWSALFGVITGFTILVRFLTLTYFSFIYAGCLAWLFWRQLRQTRKEEALQQLKNFVLTSSLAALTAGPLLWLNREWIYNYYWIGHLSGPESGIRSPHLGLFDSIHFVWDALAWHHLRGPFLLLWATSATLPAAWSWKHRAQSGTAPNSALGAASVLTALFLGVPALILTLHTQKSPFVISILIPGFLLAGLVTAELFRRRLAPETASRITTGLAVASLTWGGWHYARELSQPAYSAEFAADARKVNSLITYIRTTAQAHGVPEPLIAVDRVTDNLDALVMRVVSYERNKNWFLFTMTLPGGIMEEQESVIFERLAKSDFVFLTDPAAEPGPWPYDQQMHRLHPRLRAWCEEHLKPVETFPLFGRTLTLYERPAWPPARGVSSVVPVSTAAIRPMLSVILAVIGLVPVISYFIARRFGGGGSKIGTLLRVAVLVAVGLIAASPFLTHRAVGTGEAYNYSLSLADAVTQMREGHIPPLVGQTEFAFNGRVHPLRNAPYLFYLGGALDFVTGHTLGFWQLQNLSVALSLILAVVACYAGLRWSVGCPRLPALLLSAAYGFCPALLSAGYWFDLFMTVHTAPFLPLAAAACLRSARQVDFRNDLVLASATAAAWLAHPPVALWLTLALGLTRFVLFLRRPTWKEFVQLIVAGVVPFAALAAFVFASAATLGTVGENLSISPAAYVQAVSNTIDVAFPGSLLPVSPARNGLCSLQLGYTLWLVLTLAIFSLARTWRSWRELTWLAALALVFSSAFLLALTLPVPGLTTWLWQHLPPSFCLLTNIWPMQRVYLVASILIIFAAAVPLARESSNRKSHILIAALLLALAWSAYQASVLLKRGFDDRWSEADTVRSYVPTNVDLTVTSYAYLDTPETFVNGVMDPRFEFQLRPFGKETVINPADAVLSAPHVIARGTLQWPENHDAPATFLLQPGRRYLVNFDFRTAPLAGTLEIFGKSIARRYYLPAAGKPAGFGMNPGNRHWLSVWSSEEFPEEVSLRFTPNASATAPLTFAEYTVNLVDEEKLFVAVQSWSPLHFTVDTPEAGVLATCRQYLSGYTATVNGQSVTVAASADRQLVVTVPAGRSQVQINYEGAPIIRRTFILSALAWLALGLYFAQAILRFPLKSWGISGRRHCQSTFRWLWQHRVGSSVALMVLLLGTFGWRQYSAWQTSAGPLAIELKFPPPAIGTAEPLVVTGHTGAGDFIYVRYLDENHVRVGVDHWGVGGAESDPIKIDYKAPHTLVVQMGSLYPALNDWRWGSLSPAEQEKRKNEMVVLLDGREVLRAHFTAHPSRADEVVVGANKIGGSTTAGKFSGELLSVKRLRVSPP